MSQPIFSLTYTSVRPHLMPQVFESWNSRSALKQHEWCVGVDEDNIPVLLAAHAQSGAKVVLNTGAKTCVAGWNAAATATTGKVIIAVADDFIPPQGWDTSLLNLLPKGWEDGEHVIKVEDGYVHDIFVLAILTRKRYERFGYIFYPKYLSLFCDTEFGEVAIRDGVVIEANHLLFEHCHPDCNKRQRDGVDMMHASQERWNVGQMLFNFRKVQGFPIDDGPHAQRHADSAKTKQSTSKFNERYVAYMQVTKDDICLLDVCERLVDEGVHDFCFAQPDQYWSGEPVEPEHFAEVKAVIEALEKTGETVHHRIFHVDDYRVGQGDTRILVETRVRNESLTWIRSLDYQHILIVDGDELWIRGTLSIIKAYAEQGHKAISVHMIPVIGVPGYPVDAATDVAVVYIGADVVFKVCRSPYIQQTIVYRPLIYHFTGTRKGMEETVKKHRRSGHYDDPDYDFEAWIDKILPNVKPGLENAHMYKPRQIWPRVRAWRPDELSQIPEEIRKFLGS